MPRRISDGIACRNACEFGCTSRFSCRELTFHRRFSCAEWGDHFWWIGIRRSDGIERWDREAEGMSQRPLRTGKSSRSYLHVLSLNRINAVDFDLRDRMCRSRCVLRVNVAEHIEQAFCRSGPLVFDGLLDPPGVFCSKSPEVIGR